MIAFILNTISGHIRVFILLIPIAAVIWECAMVSMVGGDRVWRRFGMAAYISGFVLLVGSIYQFKKPVWDNTLALLLFTMAIGAFMPFVALLIRETTDGSLVRTNGPRLTRYVGVFVYFLCLLTVLDNA